MMLLILIVKDDTVVRKVVRVLVEMELFDSTVLDGEAVENLAMRSVPMFEDIARMFGQALSYNRTLMVGLRHRQEAEVLTRLCRRDGVDLCDPAVATAWLIPCERLEPSVGRAEA